MSDLNLTVQQLAAAVSSKKFISSVRLTGKPGDWWVFIWMDHDQEGFTSYGLASARDVSKPRTFKTADAAIRVLHELGLHEIKINWT